MMSAVPWKYNFRSVIRRSLRSILTVVGVALSVFVSVAMMGLSRGLVETSLGSGSPDNILVLSYGAESMEFSAIEPEALRIIMHAKGIATVGNEPLISPEAYVNTQVKVPEIHVQSSAVLVRGIRKTGLLVHGDAAIVDGHFPERGFEIAVGPLVATRLGLPQGTIKKGMSLEFEGHKWLVTGMISAPGKLYESEIWTNLEDLMTATKRDDYSALIIKTSSGSARDDLLFDLKMRTDVRTTCHIESRYYISKAQDLRPIQVISIVMTGLLMLGGLMAGMNTMFNSVMGRLHEIALLLVIGYRRRSVMMSFVIEGVLLCLAGGILGCAGGVILNGLPMKFSMSAFRFKIDLTTLGIGLAISGFIGLAGSLVPVSRVAGMSALEGMKA